MGGESAVPRQPALSNQITQEELTKIGRALQATAYSFQEGHGISVALTVPLKQFVECIESSEPDPSEKRLLAFCPRHETIHDAKTVIRLAKIVFHEYTGNLTVLGDQTERDIVLRRDLPYQCSIA
jgi:hypothetical protein